MIKKYYKKYKQTYRQIVYSYTLMCEYINFGVVSGREDFIIV